MRMTTLFGKTLREDQGAAPSEGYRLLQRAGFLRAVTPEASVALPLAQRSLRKIEDLAREALNAIGGQEFSLPQEACTPHSTLRPPSPTSALNPSGDGAASEPGMKGIRWVSALARREIQSYRQLPLTLFRIATLPWDSAPAPNGASRTAHELLLESFSLDSRRDGLEAQLEAHRSAFARLLERCFLPARLVVSGNPSPLPAKAYAYLAPSGEEIYLLCRECGYAADRKVARLHKSPADREDPKPTEFVATPGAKTIEALASLLDISTPRTAKAVFLMAKSAEEDRLTEDFVFAIVRGDMEVNLAKLSRTLGAIALRPATEEEILSVGAVPGYASPVGLSGARVIIDEAIALSPNLVAGANRAGYHLLNVNYPRDFAADLVADIALARPGDGCPICTTPMHSHRGSEVAHWSEVGDDRLRDRPVFLDQDGRSKPVWLGRYQLGLLRLLVAIAEEHRDQDGLRWPAAVSPFQVHLVSLGATRADADRLFEELRGAGFEVLFDDRDERAGVKFKDADLIGLPLRLTLSERSLEQGGVEFKRRESAQVAIAPRQEIIVVVRRMLRESASSAAS